MATQTPCGHASRACRVRALSHLKPRALTRELRNAAVDWEAQSLQSRNRLASLPYHAVQYELPDGSHFLVSAEHIVSQAAHLIANRTCTPARCLEYQLLPLVASEPLSLLDLARRLTWADLLAHAFRRFICSSIERLLGTSLQSAHLSLLTEQAPRLTD